MRDKLIEELNALKHDRKLSIQNGDGWFVIESYNSVIEWLEDFLERTSAEESDSIRVLELSTRAENVLRRAYINTISDLQSYSEEELRTIRNMGTKSLAEIYEKLENYKEE